MIRLKTGSPTRDGSLSRGLHLHESRGNVRHIGGRLKRGWLLAVVAAAALALVPGQASAAKPHFFKCKEAPGGKCGTLKVPLDRLGTSDKKIKIFFEYYKPTNGGPADEAIVTSGGGPGSSATQEPVLLRLLEGPAAHAAL